MDAVDVKFVPVFRIFFSKFSKCFNLIHATLNNIGIDEHKHESTVKILIITWMRKSWRVLECNVEYYPAIPVQSLLEPTYPHAASW